MLRLTSILSVFFIVISTVFLCSSAGAQLCTGSLGDPVVNIDFGDGYGANTGYTPTNAYVYTAAQCPNDGFYTITRSSSNCFGNTWHTVSSDHTGNGAFLLVNASYTPGDFIVTRVTDLCPNITYEFAAWVLNIINHTSIRPNITFSIETETGTVLQQYNTGDIPETTSPQWKQYGFFFTTPVNNPVIVLRMRNNAPGGIGNDIAMDDITFRPCSAALLTSHVNNSSSDTVSFCEGSAVPVVMNGNVSGAYTSPVYQWQQSNDSGKTWKDIAGARSLTYTATPTTAGAWWYRFTAVESTSAANNACRIASNYTVVNVHEKPKVNAGGNKIMITGHPLILQGSAAGTNLGINWSPAAYLDDAAKLTPTAEPPTDTRYTLLARTAFGCFSTDTAFIKVIKGIFVPNVFSPNNDGKNDRWRIPYLDAVPGAKVRVYNRYGQLVYFSDGPQVNWDGTYKTEVLPGGVYVYYVEMGNGFPDMKGTVLLLR